MEIRINDESVIVVLADGLGSGVKANILATMTSTIAATMLEDKMSLKDVVEIEENDVLGFFSDGVIHAGVGTLLNFGWQWEDAADYLLARTYDEKMVTSKDISMRMIETCNDLYGGEPGDDTTVVVMKAEEHQYVTLFSGPPLDRTKDQMIREILDLSLIHI